MNGNPQVFITGVGFYNEVGQLVAVAKLSSPLKKSFYRKDWKFFRIDKEFYDFFI